MQRILVIDNFDSFTFNLVQQIDEITGIRPDVIRNDQLQQNLYEQYDTFFLSPGPGIPEEAGNLLSFIASLPEEKKLLGICLGHQAIAQSFGGSIAQLDQVYHGVADTIYCESDDPLFNGMDGNFSAGRYHSWHVKLNANGPVKVIGRDQSGTIMAIRHLERPIVGIQFHPESVLTPQGHTIITNFLMN